MTGAIPLPVDETYFEENGNTYLSSEEGPPTLIARFTARIAEQIERHEAGTVRRI